MWRLKAIELASDGPVHEAYIELTDVTVLTGTNDAGKTRLLHAIAQGLMDPDESHGATDLYGIARSSDVRAMIDPDPEEGDTEELVEEAAPLTDIAEFLSLDLPADEIPVGIRLIQNVRSLPAFRYGKSVSELSAELRRQVVERISHEPEAPLALEWLGGADPKLLPRAIVIPSPDGTLEEEVAATSVQLARGLRLLPQRWQFFEEMAGPLDGPLDSEWSSPEFGRPSEGGSWLLLEDPTTTSHHPAGELVCQCLTALTADLLPSFITSRYDPIVALASPSAIATGQSIHLMLATIDWDPEAETGTVFAIEEAASGFAVWIELAFREAVARLQVLGQILEDGVGHLLQAQRTLAFGTHSGLDKQVRVIASIFRRVLLSLEDPISNPPGDVLTGFDLPDRRVFRHQTDGADYTDQGWLSPAVLSSRLYLLDEPEQRLHPQLQRRAAAWLGELMQTWRSQCILATHSVAFIDMPGEPNVFSIVREGSASIVERFDLETFDAHAQFAREMGFDRGELLTRWRAFLFVEGRTDLAVLEELLGREIRDARICLLPVFGHRNHAGLIDMATLTLGTAAPVAALFDAISDADVEQLRNADARRRAEARGLSGELGTVANIIELELRREGRRVEIIGIGVPDIFDLLDEAVIRRLTSRHHGGNRFPGHKAAREAFAAEGGGNAAKYKTFIRDRFGVSTSERQMRLVAREMVRRGVPAPNELQDVVLRVDRLAAEQD